MTLFGRTLGGEEIASLAFMLATLVLWLFVLRGERDWRRWFRGRKAGREAETVQRPRADDPPSGSARGPWG